MLIRISRTICFALLLVGVCPIPTSAQHADGPTPRFYGLLSAGAATTVGTEDASFGLGSAATAITGGVSARLHPAFALDLTQTGTFGGTVTRWTTRLNSRLVWSQRLASPYLLAGLSGTSSDGFNLGAALGLGLDWTVSPRIDLFQQVTFDLPFTNDAFGASTRGLGFVGGGLRLRIAPNARPVRSLSLVVPDTARVREAVLLTAVPDGRAAHPIEYVWTFDDGYTATGEVISREFRYARPYTATVIASNREGSFSATQMLQVHPTPAPKKTEEEPVITGGSAARDVEILELYGKRTLDVDEPETYRLRLARRVTNDIHYEWDFGDGVASIRNSVTHRYSSPGTYTLRAIARTATGADTLITTITVGAPPAPVQPRAVAPPRMPAPPSAPPAPAPAITTQTVSVTAGAPLPLPRRTAPAPTPAPTPALPPPAATSDAASEPPAEPATLPVPVPSPEAPRPQVQAAPLPAPPPTPAPARPEPAQTQAPVSEEGPFGWMVAAFRDKARADALANTARNAMMAAQVVTDVPPQGPAVYRVIVGRYPTEAAAKRERYKAQALTRGPVRLTPLDTE